MTAGTWHPDKKLPLRNFEATLSQTSTEILLTIKRKGQQMLVCNLSNLLFHSQIAVCPDQEHISINFHILWLLNRWTHMHLLNDNKISSFFLLR